ncbi:diguanylate cyclase domain protein [Lysobacter antibioticus]|uniref:GGDEF domain-containing protein n=1 Tax=Lysobacter antibioticus TaxID=84531 RepID=UPI0007220725|nr:GGDEF domain-containing protein [Lysobacter antibioticus]ALN64566.1 diguanylate cyclase domain protein [Lysobacter antibioticus]
MEGFRRQIGRVLALVALWTFATGGWAADFRLERLDASSALPPEQIVAGARDSDFRSVGTAELVNPTGAPRWWRVTLLRSVADTELPQLVFTHPSRKTIELWQPGASAPFRRASHDPQSRGARSTRFHVFGLEPDLQAGDVLYLRVTSKTRTPSVLSIVPLADVYEAELAHVRYRTSVLVALALISVLAFGYFIALSERGYVYLGLTLAAQLSKLMIDGGEIAQWPWLAEMAADRRAGIVISTAAVLTGIRFIAFFLGLSQHQPRIARALNVCSALLGGLLLISVIQVWPISAYFGNTVMLAAFSIVAIAGLRALRRHQREALYLLIAWAPVMAILVAVVGGYQAWWPMTDWIESSLPAGLAFSGFGLFLGLTDRLRQLRKDRDAAQQRWTFDRLTGVITRDAVEVMLLEQMKRAVRYRQPLAVIFIDIDRFKEINDRYGHVVGDDAIRIVAMRARNWLRAEHLIARYGGDEMLVVLYGQDQRAAVEVAESLRMAVTLHPMSMQGLQLPVTLSMGVADLQAGDTLTDLLNRADAALYQSKMNGRNRVTAHSAVVDTSSQPPAARRLSPESVKGINL